MPCIGTGVPGWRGCGMVAAPGSVEENSKLKSPGAPDSTLMTYWVCPEGPAARFNPKAEQDSKKGSGHLLEPSQAPTRALGVARLESSWCS